MRYGFTTFILLSATPLAAGEDYNLLGKWSYSQWDCAAYASYTERFKREGEILFENGYSNISVFVEAWREGKLSDENTSEVPVGITWNLIGGPSVDFSLGFMWAQFLDEAYEETWDGDLDGSFEDLKELQVIKAENAFREKNCALLAE